MSVTTENDPIEAIIDILEAGTWSNATKPSRIVRSEAYTPSDKKQWVQDDAIYVYAVTESNILGITGQWSKRQETQTITLDMWSPTSAAQAFNLYRDAVSITAAFANNNGATTPFTRIRPRAPADLRQEHHVSSGSHWRYNLDVEMTRVD